MVANPDKVRENKTRRHAERLGFMLKKSRARNWNINDQGGYMLVDISTNVVIQGSRFDWSLSDIEGYLDDYEADLKKQMQDKNK